MVSRPPPLVPGAPIAVVAPASPPKEYSTYERGLARLRELYDVQSVWRPGSERGYLAAPDETRVEALHSAIENPDIRAMVCVRGGYGCVRLLSRIDWDLAKAHPTLLVGYSDVTALHLAFYSRARWSAISGPVVTEWNKIEGPTGDSFDRLARGTGQDLMDGFDATLTTEVAGTAEGPLLGGNLSVLCALIGTPYAPDFSGAILVLEEVCEAPYRVDRKLAHLDGAGVLDAVNGVVLGEFTTGDLDPDKPTLSLDAVFDDYFSHRAYPVLSGLPYGHLLPRISLPIGVPVSIHSSRTDTEIRALEPVVGR